MQYESTSTSKGILIPSKNALQEQFLPGLLDVFVIKG